MLITTLVHLYLTAGIRGGDCGDVEEATSSPAVREAPGAGGPVPMREATGARGPAAVGALDGGPPAGARGPAAGAAR